uniref:MYND-type domain-containing protein n=1 Tax=Macrostomum lignano TaxID=282301 RepID=A0A1I8F608_9PLAT
MVDEMEQLELTQPNSDRAAQLLGLAGLRALLKRIPAGQVRPGLGGSTSSGGASFERPAPVESLRAVRSRLRRGVGTSSEFVASNADLLLRCCRQWSARLAGISCLRGCRGGWLDCSLASLYSAALQQGLPAAGGPGAHRLCQCVRNLCQHSGGCCSSLDRLPAALASQAAEAHRQSLGSCRLASSASGAADASAGVSEAADSLLDAWAHLFAADSSFRWTLAAQRTWPPQPPRRKRRPPQQSAQSPRRCSPPLMRSRLAPPDGFAALAAMQQRQATEADDDDESVHELEETDQVRFASALAAAGEFGAPGAGALDQRAETAGWSSAAWGVRCRRLVASEDAHWLLLVVGHVIVEPDAEEAAPFVPRSLMSESLAQSANVGESVRALCEACQGQGRAGGGHSQQVDRLLQLVAAVMRMACLLARTAPEPPAGTGLTNRLASARLSDETLYDTISPSHPCCFRQDSGESLRCCAQFAVDYCRVCLARWPGAPRSAVHRCPGRCQAGELCPPRPTSRPRTVAIPTLWNASEPTGVTVGRLQLRAGELISSGLPATPQPRPPRPRPRTLWPAVAMPLSLNRLCCHSLKLPPICQPWLPTPLPDAAGDRLWCASLLRRVRHRRAAPASRTDLQASPSRGQSGCCVELSDSAARPTRRARPSAGSRLLHSMLSQSLLDFWSEPEEHLLDGGETASTCAETRSRPLCPDSPTCCPRWRRRLAEDPAELAEPTLRLCVAAAEAASDRLLAMPEEALNTGELVAGESPSDSRRLACECVSALALSAGRCRPPRRSAAGRLLCPQSNSAPSDPAGPPPSLDGLDSGGSAGRSARVAWLLSGDPAARFAALADAWLISDGGSSPDERRRERLGDALNQLATGVAEAAAASSRTAPSGSVNGAGAQSRRFPDRPARLAFAEQFEMFLVRLRAICD